MYIVNCIFNLGLLKKNFVGKIMTVQSKNVTPVFWTCVLIIGSRS